MTRTLGTALIALALTLAGCGSSGATADKVKPKFDKKAYVAQVTQAASDASGGAKITAGCHLPTYTWQCFYDHLEAPYKGRIDIHLKTSGDVTATEVKDMSRRARLWWFNMAGGEVKNLDLAVTFANGRDTGTTYRREVPLLNR